MSTIELGKHDTEKQVPIEFFFFSYDGVVRVEVDLEGTQARKQLPHNVTRDGVILCE